MPGGGIRVVTRFRVTPGLGTPADQMPLAGVITHGGQLTTARRAVRRKARGLRLEGPGLRHDPAGTLSTWQNCPCPPDGENIFIAQERFPCRSLTASLGWVALREGEAEWLKRQ